MSLTTAVLLYENFTALDVIGPYEVLVKLPGSKILFTAGKKGDYSDPHGLKLSADFDLDDITSADILLVPGGFGIDAVAGDTRTLEWVRKLDITTTWTAAVCSGSLLLAAAGLLKDRRCTTHWRRMDQLRGMNVRAVVERYVRDGKYITSAGVSAGIDMALFLAGLVAGDRTAMMIQKVMEYDPRPPYDYGMIEP